MPKIFSDKSVVTKFFRSVVWAGALAFASGGVSSAMAFTPIPARPIQGIVDGGKVLPLSIAKSLERLLLEHQTMTGETIHVLTLEKSLYDEKLEDYSMRVFDEWRTTTPKPTSTVVLVFDLIGKKMALRAGVGLDAVLAERGGDAIASLIANPEMRHRRADRAVLLSVRRVFELLESPVFVNGNFDREVRDAGFLDTFTPYAETRVGRSWWIWILSGFVLCILVGYRILAVEVHYTAEGWTRIPPWENFVRYLKSRSRKAPALVTGGGVSGHY